MEEETTLTADPQADSAGAENQNEENGTAQPSERKMIPFPADKLRAMNRELAELRSQSRGSTLQTTPKTPLPAEAEQALDLIADRTAGRFSHDLSAVRDELDDLTMDREIARIEQDPRSSAYRDEFLESLQSRIKGNPKARMGDLIAEAKRDAVFKAYESGKLAELVNQEAQENIQNKVRVSTPQKGAASNQRGKSERTVDDMTPEELAADPKLYAAYFEKAMGRKPRR